jgi:DNA-binding GntR family transcriptional regulator
MSSESSTIPQYRRLHEILKEQILVGRYPEGSLLPSEHELSAMHGVARETVRQGLAELVADGLIEKKKGKGSIVSARRKRLALLSFRGFSEVIGATRHRMNTVVLQEPVPGPWPDPFFYPLSESEAAAGTIFLERLRGVEDEPVMLECTYLPDLELPEFCSHPLVNGSLFDTLATRYGIVVDSVEQDVRAVAADPEVAAMLRVDPDAPVLHMYRRYGTSRTGFNVYSSLFCTTDQYAIGTSYP